MAHILIVEDDEILTDILSDWLTQGGHLVSVVNDGFEAIAATERRAPDLLILDYDLPGVTGLEVLRAARRRPGADTLPILMLTAKPGRLLRERAHLDGIDEFLQKPIAPAVVLQRVEALLQSATMARRLKRWSA